MEQKTKHFLAKTIDDIEEQLDTFVESLGPHKLISVSLVGVITSGYYSMSCEYIEDQCQN